MTDLLHTLPDFPTRHYTHLIPSLEKNLISTTDLLTLDPLEIAKRAQLPLLDIRRFKNHVLASLQSQLGLQEGKEALRKYEPQSNVYIGSTLRQSGTSTVQGWNVISTLDPTLDAALGGGIPTSYITEVTGESGAGKTQLLLTLLLSAQLSPPHGLARPSVYISTEHPLPTTRLNQILTTHPLFSSTASSSSSTASLNNIYTLSLPDLESQDHILTYQLPVLLSRHRPGLIVIDSITANYRAEQRSEGSTSGAALGLRSSQLLRLGHLLRSLAREHDCAIVVANQVADRFSPDPTSSPPPQLGSSPPSSSPLSSNNSQQQQMPSLDALIMPAPPPPPPSTAQPSNIPAFPPLTLNHQQNFFTGWSSHNSNIGGAANLKTPSLGLVWSNQLACRIALIKSRAEGKGKGEWKRYLKVVFSAWGPATPVFERGTEIEVWEGGVRGVVGEE
ncbi:MAG: hypothetical protein Q9222_001400 [Ikaeria aurantiellina]